MSEPNATFCLLVPDLTTLSHEKKDALIVKLWSETVALRLEVEHLRNLNTTLERRLSELENKLNQPPKDSSNSSIPPSKDRKKNKSARPTRKGVRRASIGRKGGGRPLDPNPVNKSMPRPKTALTAVAKFQMPSNIFMPSMTKSRSPLSSPSSPECISTADTADSAIKTT